MVARLRLTRAMALLVVPTVGAWLASFALWRDEAGRIVTGLQSGWGDLLFHLRVVTYLQFQGGPTDSVLLAGESVGYAYAADGLSSLVAWLGVPLVAAVSWPTITLVFICLTLMGWISWRVSGYWVSGVVMPLLWVGFGGLSGWYIVPEVLREPSWWDALRHLPHGVTAWHDAQMVVLNPFVMMLHQRGYLLGFPLLVLTLWAGWVTLERRATWALLILTALTIGLAFVHPFTWLTWLLLWPGWVAGFVIVRRSLLRPLELWWGSLALVVSAVVGAAIIVQLQPNAGGQLGTWALGWLAEPLLSWPWFWIKNIGLYVGLWPVAIWWLWRRYPLMAALLLGATLPFIAANSWQFAPWLWDNTKVFAPVWVVLCLGVSVMLGQWWKWGRWWHRGGVAMVLLCLTSSGGLEVLRLVTHWQDPAVISTRADEALGIAVRAVTTSADRVLFLPEPNQPVFLFSGRPALTAYEGWLWSQGWRGRYEDRLVAVRTIYQGGDEAVALLDRYRISYVVIGPTETARQVNEAWFAAQYPVALTLGQTRLYNTRPLTPARE